MITENGPTSMQIDYVLPDRMHQTVTVQTTNKTTELILVGNQAWAKQGEGGWQLLPQQVADQLKSQMQESVIAQQTDVGSYACKGRTQFDGRDVLSYKLDSEPEKGSTRGRKPSVPHVLCRPTDGLAGQQHAAGAGPRRKANL